MQSRKHGTISKLETGLSQNIRRNLKTRTKSITTSYKGLKQNIGYQITTGKDNIITRTTKKHSDSIQSRY